MKFEYSPSEKKVINDQRAIALITDEMQLKLDYIANAIHDAGCTPSLSSSGMNDRWFRGVNIEYRYEELLFTFLVDKYPDTTVTMHIDTNATDDSELNYCSDHSSILSKISKRYHIDLVIYSTSVKSESKLVLPIIKMMKGLDFKKIQSLTFANVNDSDNYSSKQPAIDKLIKFCGNIKALPNLEKLEFNNPVTEKDCELLSNLISDGSFADRVISILCYNLKPYNSLNGFYKLMDVCKSNEDALIYLFLYFGDDKGQLLKINTRTHQREDFIVNSIVRMVKEGSSCLGKILSDNDNVRLLWKFGDSNKIQRKVLEELNKEENNTYTLEQVESAVTDLQVFIFEGYFLPEIKDQEIKLNFEKLPLELQEKLVKDFRANPQEHDIEESFIGTDATISGDMPAYNDMADSSN